MVYQARKASKVPKIRLDLTKQMLNAIGKMNDTLKSRNIQDSFAFADINCRIYVKINDEFHRPFSYSAKEPGSSIILIHFYTRDSIEWR